MSVAFSKPLRFFLRFKNVKKNAIVFACYESTFSVLIDFFLKKVKKNASALFGPPRFSKTQTFWKGRLRFFLLFLCSNFYALKGVHLTLGPSFPWWYADFCENSYRKDHHS